MSKGINKVILVGNLGKDPEMKYTASGIAIANITVATSESWTDKQTNQKVEKTEWHRVVFFRRLAEVVGEYLTKGSQVYIEGRLQTRKWQDQNGQDRYTTEVIGDKMQMLGSKPSGSGQDSQNQNQTQQQSRSGGFRRPGDDNTPHGGGPQQGGFDDGGFTDDDIPF